MRVHKSQQVIRELSDGERGIASWRLTVTARIQGYDAKMLRKSIQLMCKVADILPITVQQDQWEASPLFDIVVFNFHHVNAIKDNNYGIIFVIFATGAYKIMFFV